ncbi:MAG: GNAT family N-acetyltransferase [Spirochaetales bacterium]|nr:GNAT family N-acetyltransferase [Spirochaetales bacterium]
MSQIFKLDAADLDTAGVLDFIQNREESHLYWSDDWSPSFYSRLAYEGLISTTYPREDGSFVLLPEMQRAYAVLDWENLHISRQVSRLLSRVERGEFTLGLNRNFEAVLENIRTWHDPCWMTSAYGGILRVLNRSDNPYACRVLSVELFNDKGELIAGELGYRIGRIYTSLSGFTDRERGPAGCGTLQMVLLAGYLENEGYSFWNLGHPHMEYKERFGARNLTREDFLKRWKTGRDLSF